MVKINSINEIREVSELSESSVDDSGFEYGKGNQLLKNKIIEKGFLD
jgi:hypothetical protein